MRCDICSLETRKYRHLPIYIKGSEGIEICFDCEMVLVEIIRKMRAAVHRGIKQKIMEAKHD